MTSLATRSKPDLEVLARRVRNQMRCLGANDLYEFFDYPNLWGEFCHWVQYDNCAPISGAAWKQSTMALVWGVIEGVSRSHYPVLTEMAELELGEFRDAPEKDQAYVDRNLIERGVWECLVELASSSNIRRYVPVGLKDQYF